MEKPLWRTEAEKEEYYRHLTAELAEQAAQLKKIEKEIIEILPQKLAVDVQCLLN